MQWDGLQKQECSGINPIVRYLAEDVSLAVQSEMAERKRQRMYFVREPSQAQSSDKLDAEITSLIEKATKHREQLDKLDNTFNEARVRTGRLGKILDLDAALSPSVRLSIHPSLKIRCQCGDM